MQKHLSILKRQGVIREWYDREITAGTEWKGQLDQHLNAAGVILLLVSAAFLASDYCYDVEMRRALERHDQGEARVIPVILRMVDGWQLAPFGKIQSLPTDGKPVTSWKIRDEAFADVARGIRNAIGQHGVHQTEPPPGQFPFFVPFPRNLDFVGRTDDLERLHATLQEREPVGIRPAGLTGMGGIGKTQLAVEYVYQQKDDFPDGIFWIDATGPLAEGFARLATDSRLRWAQSNRPRDEQIRAACAELNRRPNALLVLDNLPEPAALAVPLLPDCVPEDLRCQLLFTTRRNDLGRFAGVKVTVLPEDPALRLLLRHVSRRAALLDSSHPDHQHARAIARMLGRLPLALELAGAYLGKFSRDVSLAGYREGLKSDGALATLDADVAELTEADLRRVHAPAVAATIGEQWNALRDDSARLLLRVTALFPESAAEPIPRLGVLAGLGDEARPGRLSLLRRAVKRLEDACLVERLEADQVRLHPLVREFARSLTPEAETPEFRLACAGRMAAAYEDYATLEEMARKHPGVTPLEDDLLTALGFCPSDDKSVQPRLQSMLRVLQRESHRLRTWDPKRAPAIFPQQIRNRAFLLGPELLVCGAEARLTGLGQGHALLRWRTSLESPALVRTLSRHGGGVRALALTGDGRVVSGSYDGTVKVWDLNSGQEQRTLSGHGGVVWALAMTGDGRVVSGSYEGTVKLWDLNSAHKERTLSGHGGVVYALAMTGDGRVVSGSYDGTVKVWDLNSAHKERTLSGHGGWVNALAMTRDGRVVSGADDGTVKVWDLASGQEQRTLSGHGGAVNALAMTGDGRVVSGSSDGTVKVWDLASGQEQRALSGHGGWVNALAMTGDGRVVSGSEDGTVKVWDLNSGSCLATVLLDGSPRSLDVKAGSDGVTLVVGEASGAVSCFRLVLP